MSDTPRMKAAQMAAIEHMTGDVYRVGCDLEIELNAANERIKRLEEAGDALCAAAAFMGWHMEIEKWNKAKEAKP
jgi:hypothetical protein